MHESSYAIVEAPSTLGLLSDGVEQLGETLLSAGLADRLGARRAVRVEPPPRDSRRHPQHGMLNASGIARYTPALATAVGAVLDGGEFPIVLGGDCSIVLGNLLALRRRGRFGLLFIDGHADYYQPEANVNGEAASSDLALATGRGPVEMVRYEGYERLVRDEDVVALGFRDEAEQRHYGSEPLPRDVLSLGLNVIRERGIDAATETAVERLTRSELEGFWIHCDADVLDVAIMPAVDYHLPGGLSWDELVTTLRIARASPRAVGIEVTIYNPRLDPERTIAPALADALIRGLQ